MATPVGPDAAAVAREEGNDFYRAGKLSQAEKAYKKAASLAPNDSSPISNLSAVRYEMGDYRGAVVYARKAIALTATDDSLKRDKLYGRLAKCLLHVLEFSSADGALSRISDTRLRAELHESVQSLKALWAEVPDESVFRRPVLDHLPYYKPCLQDIPEYYCVGHDDLEALTEPIKMKGAESLHISILFAGSGDGRNLLAAITAMTGTELQTGRPCFKKLHFTVLDLKPAAMARLLIFFNMMLQVDDNILEAGLPNTDHFLAMAYIFSCQIIPPFVAAKLQSNISELIKRLDGENAAIPFAHVREQDKEPIIRVLRQWQQPWDGMPTVKDIRRFVQPRCLETGMRAASVLGLKEQPGLKADRDDFDKFTTLLPSAVVAQRCEPSIAEPLARYRSTGKSKRLLKHIDSNWKINNTLIDYDFANRNRELGDHDSLTIDFDPLRVVESFGIKGPTGNPGPSCIEKLGDVFRAFSVSTLRVSDEKRLVVELIVGEMADTMERIRYNLLDHRLSPSTDRDRDTLDPTTFPQTFDHVHMSNIPDYIGGHLTTFLACRPLLNEDRPSNMRFTNLLNPPEFEDHQAFQSEYLLMYDMERIHQHFLVSRRRGEVSQANLPPMFRTLRKPFAFESYFIWDKVPRSTMSFQQLLPKPEFEKWVYGHLLKICLPYPRPTLNGQPVHAPLNLSMIIRLIVGMFEVGYPAHWLIRILSCICTGIITTRARPPTSRVSTPADVDATHPAKEISITPWVAEFTTLLSIWRRLLPFGVDSLNGALVPLGNIFQYSITFPPFPPKHERIPHFVILFWNTEVGYTLKPPASIYSLLGGGEGEDNVSARDIREKGIVCVTSFQYTTASRTAVFWMRADVMEKMMAGKWRAFIWRTDAWEATTSGVDVSSGVSKGNNWTSLF